MSEIIVYIGISGSGKSTQAISFVRNNENNFIIISRDKIRELLFGYTEANIDKYYSRPDFNDRERQVTQFEDALIKEALSRGLSVVADNTHLKMKYIDKYRHFGAPVGFILVDTPLDVCIARQAGRARRVPEDVLKKQYDSLKQLKDKFDFQPFMPSTWRAPEYDPKKKDCYIFDIDGTLAEKGDRFAYDEKNVYGDDVHNDVARILNCIKESNHADIIICSGRQDSCGDETIRWLTDNAMYYDEIYMRKVGDMRKDYIVKEEMWREISKEYNILGMFDDRNQVVEHARRLGFRVYQVALGNF